MHNIKINKPNLCEKRTPKLFLNPKQILPSACMFMHKLCLPILILELHKFLEK